MAGERQRQATMTSDPDRAGDIADASAPAAAGLLNLRCEGAVRAECAVVIEIVEYGGQAGCQHLAPDVAEQLRHEEAADAGKAGVLVGEAGAAGVGLDAVEDVRDVAAGGIGPRVSQQGSLVHL